MPACMEMSSLQESNIRVQVQAYFNSKIKLELLKI
jgi:hypothetical protein